MRGPRPLQLPPPRNISDKQSEFVIGLDLGHSQDYTAVCVDEVVGDRKRLHKIRHLHRYQLMTPYQEIARQIQTLYNHPKLRFKEKHLVVDATGVGKPVVEMLQEQGLDPISVTITHGYSVTRARDRPEYNVAKRILVSAINLVIQDGRLQVASRLPLAKAFIREANNFKIKKTDDNNASYEAWRDRDHDDLVLAVAIAIWYGETELVSLPQQSAVEKRRERRRRRPTDGPRFFGELPRAVPRGKRRLVG